MLGIGEEPLGSRDIVFWFWLFAAIVAFRAVWSGFRINENVASWWEKRGSPATKLTAEAEVGVQERMRQARERQMNQHSENMDKWAAARQEEERQKAILKAQQMEKLERRIGGEDVADEVALPRGPRADNPKRRAPYSRDCGTGGGGYRPSGFPRRGGGGGG